MRFFKTISILSIIISFSVLFSDPYVVTYELTSDTLIAIGQCIELTEINNHCRLSDNGYDVIGFVALSETDGRNYYNLVVNSGRITARLSIGETVSIGARLTASHIAGELVEAGPDDRVIAIATEAITATVNSQDIEIIIQCEQTSNTTVYYADSAGWADSAQYADNAIYSDTSNFAWQVPCDSINKCINWDTLSAYSDTTHTHFIDELTDVDTSGVVVGQVLKWDGTNWVPANDSTIPESVFIWNQDTVVQPASFDISGTATAGTLVVDDISGQGNGFSDVAATYDITVVDVNVSLTELTYDASGASSTIFISFDGIFDDQNGYNGASMAIEIVRDPGPGETIVTETEVFICNDDYFRTIPVTIQGIDTPAAGSHIYEARARALSEPFTAGRCLRGRLILSEIKE